MEAALMLVTILAIVFFVYICVLVKDIVFYRKLINKYEKSFHQERVEKNKDLNNKLKIAGILDDELNKT